MERFAFIRIALRNRGSAPAKNVEIEFRFETGLVLEPEDIPVPGNTILKYYGETFAKEFIDIPKVSTVRSYNETREHQKPDIYAFMSRPFISTPFDAPRSEFSRKDFLNTAKRLFADFEFTKSPDGKVTSVRIEMEHVAHEKCYAAPAYLIITNQKIKSIPFKIFCKNIPHAVQGTLNSQVEPNQK